MMVGMYGSSWTDWVGMPLSVMSDEVSRTKRSRAPRMPKESMMSNQPGYSRYSLREAAAYMAASSNWLGVARSMLECGKIPSRGGELRAGGAKSRSDLAADTGSKAIWAPL